MKRVPPENFLGLEGKFADPETARYAVLLMPFEETVTYKKGTAGGPLAILDASHQVELFDEQFHREFHHAGVATYPVIQPAPWPDMQFERVREAALPLLQEGKFVLSLGGEHSLTAPLVRATHEVHEQLSVLQIDAHADLRDTYEGLKESHACVMRRVLEVTDSICQVGIRSFSLEEFNDCPRQVEAFFAPERIARQVDWIDQVLAMLGDKVYVTIDMDGFDPSIAPGVGTPEPGGLSWQQVTSLLYRVCTERTVVAADIMETRPLGENHITEFTAARLAYKIIAYTQLGDPSSR